MEFLRLLLPFLVAIVVAVLFAGVIVMARGGETSKRWSNKLMQARVWAQFVAILVIAPAAWYLGSPLIIRTELKEPPPAAAVSPGPGAAAGQPSSPATASPATATASLVPGTAAPRTPDPTPAATPDVRSGAFAGADDFHFGRGRATLTVAPDGRHTLRFDGFSVRNGPDLYVYLSPDPAGYADGAVELGRPRATDGSFTTPIPPGVDAGAARSVVIWCREFAVLFAVAPLDG